MAKVFGKEKVTMAMPQKVTPQKVSVDRQMTTERHAFVNIHIVDDIFLLLINQLSS